MTTQPTCEERVNEHRDSRIEDLRVMLTPTTDDIRLVDDGTLDTVLGIGDDIEVRYSQDEREAYCDDAGEFDLDEFISDHESDMFEAAHDAFTEYGLSFDYVAPDTFTDQDEGYFRYQISCGGPSEEFRFFVNPDFSLHRAEFWFLDWFDGARRNVTSDDTARTLFQWFEDCEGLAPMYQQAMDDA